MKLLSWNILHGGGARILAICDAVIRHDPDVVIFNEYRARPGERIRATLAEAGYLYWAATNPVGSDNGICVAARTPLRAKPTSPAPPENAVRWIDVDLPEYGFGFAAIHIITAGSNTKERAGVAKTRFWDAVLDAASQRQTEPTMFIGDLNTGLHRIDERSATFYCAEHFGRMTASGWTDAWRHFHGLTFEPTWMSHGRNGTPGNPFRLDHAFVSPVLLPRVKDCYYSHAEREARISDHSALIVDIEPSQRSIL